MLVAQLTDLHITTSGGPTMVDTSATLARAVTHIVGLDPRPDVVVITGDLTNDGTADEYALLRSLLEPIDLPLVLVAGNHDHRDVLRAELADRFPSDVPDGHLSYVIEEHEVRLVVLDTTEPTRHDGVLPPDRIAWLTSVLDEAPDRPTAICMHHPPFRTGIRWMDLAGLADSPAFRSAVVEHPQVRHVMAGHLHRPIHTTIGSASVTVCPSTCHQLDLELHPGCAGLVDEPPGYQLHLWTEEGVVTHTGMVWEGVRIDVSDMIEGIERRAANGDPFVKGETGG